ncbi:MAG: GNAT family N-acetyltransferase [Clostridia bacterium]|nr:GNAT family N-acetyltransferase [Clostridia bacterium]
MLVRPYRPEDEIGGLMEGQYAPGAEQLLLRHPDFDPRRAWVAEEAGRVTGFACCTGEFLACLLGDREELLDAAVQDAGLRGYPRLRVSYFCPIRLPWVIPDSGGALHNNRPGLPVGSPEYGLLERCGWRETSRQVGMYLSLADYAFPAEMTRKAEEMAQKGYFVDWYDETRHKGVDEMVESLHNSMWSAEIPAAAHGGLPLLVGLEGDTVAGFTGPVRPEACGRGYFAGIAVGPDWEGHGLGKLLFYRLLEAEKAVGARYMTLFTGVTNHAGEMYRKAGFRDVREFAVMEKEF